MLGLYGFCEGLLADRQPSLDILQLPLEAFLLHAFTTLGVYSAPPLMPTELKMIVTMPTIF